MFVFDRHSFFPLSLGRCATSTPAVGLVASLGMLWKMLDMAQELQIFIFALGIDMYLPKAFAFPNNMTCSVVFS